MDKLHFLKKLIENKKVLLLGFGREGQASFNLLQKLNPQVHIIIADNKYDIQNLYPHLIDIQNISWSTGDEYLSRLDEADLIVKSPGIPLKRIPEYLHNRVTSQTEWFITAYRDQICGITGTKGKSTTSALLYHIFKEAGRNTLLVGNIGIPPFSMTENINNNTIIVNELSCHQLQNIHVSPSGAILLNIFQEHLDHYRSLKEYQLTKINIARYQEAGDYLIVHADDPVTKSYCHLLPLNSKIFRYSLNKNHLYQVYPENDAIVCNTETQQITLFEDIRNLPLAGDHNLLNMMAAASMAYIKGVTPETIHKAVHSFKPLEHRLENVGTFNGIIFYNDSISTIPESAIEAMKTLKNVHTLILGGIDRGIEYKALIDYLFSSCVKVIILTGEAGKRIEEEIRFRGKKPFETILANNYIEVVETAIKRTPAGNICLLSPAAASYDWFKNFEERGTVYKQLILNYHS